MATRDQMFSDSWHRVAPEIVRLKASAEVAKQVFRGETWYVVRDPLNNEFFRMSSATWQFVGRLRGDRTVDETWRETLALFPDEAPGQDEVIQVLSQLYQSNLLHSKLAPDSRQLFDRQKKEKQKKVRGQAVNFLFLNIPLFDPNRFLDLIRPLTKLFLNPVGFAVWLAVVVAGLWTALGHFEALSDRGGSVLAPANLIWLYVAMAFIKVLHEFGHAVVCKRFGGEVHTAGIMLMMLAPLPYVDATSSWAFRDRRKRIMVSAAGMGVEFFVASIALFVWISTTDPLVSRLAFNIIFIASVSTVLFNANPLLRFDGYYIFSDLFDLPNLYQRATRQLKHLGERYIYGVKSSSSPAHKPSEATWLTVYGIASFIYRIVLLCFITYTVAQSLLGIGVLIAWFCVVVYFLFPMGKMVKYLATSQRLARTRRRAVTITVMLLALLTTGILLMPMPRSFRAPGVFEVVNSRSVTTKVAGFIDQVLVTSTQQVEIGQPLVLLRNPDLERDIESTQLKIQQIRSQIEEARQNRFSVVIGPLQNQVQAGQLMLKRLLDEKQNLLVKAPTAGTWSAPLCGEMNGAWSPRGTELGRVVDQSNYTFLAVVDQEDATNLFNDDIKESEIRVVGQAESLFPVTLQKVVPSGQAELPSAALGWLAGGEIELQKGDNTGKKANENFYLVRCQLDQQASTTPKVYPSMTGQIRFSLTPEPLFNQWSRMLLQLFQGNSGK